MIMDQTDVSIEGRQEGPSDEKREREEERERIYLSLFLLYSSNFLLLDF